MAFIVPNEILLGLIMNITEYLMILLILMKLVALNSLHRDCYMLHGDEWR